MICSVACAAARDFYPRSPCGERRSTCTTWTFGANFYPRSPCGERRQVRRPYYRYQHISIHALLAESDVPDVRNRLPKGIISIHALLAESDKECKRKVIAAINISIHALLAESDRKATNAAGPNNQISIHALLAESDRHDAQQWRSQRYFYPRSPCGERQLPTVPQGLKSPISIHALLAESDMGRY